jgi:hypothetical protein
MKTKCIKNLPESETYSEQRARIAKEQMDLKILVQNPNFMFSLRKVFKENKDENEILRKTYIVIGYIFKKYPGGNGSFYSIDNIIDFVEIILKGICVPCDKNKIANCISLCENFMYGFEQF